MKRSLSPNEDPLVSVEGTCPVCKKLQECAGVEGAYTYRPNGQRVRFGADVVA